MQLYKQLQYLVQNVSYTLVYQKKYSPRLEGRGSQAHLDVRKPGGRQHGQRRGKGGARMGPSARSANACTRPYSTPRVYLLITPRAQARGATQFGTLTAPSSPAVFRGH